MFKAIALGSEFKDVAGVCEPVKESAQESVIVKDLRPFCEGQVGGDENGAALVALGEKGEEHLRTLLRERDKAEFINDNELLFEESILQTAKGLVLLRFDELVDEGSGGEKPDFVSRFASGIAKSGSDMGFASANFANENSILIFADELTASEFHDFLLGKRRNGSEIVGIQGIGNGKLSLFEQTATTVDLTQREFLFEQRAQIFGIGFAFFFSLPGKRDIVFGDGREAKFFTQSL